MKYVVSVSQTGSLLIGANQMTEGQYGLQCVGKVIKEIEIVKSREYIYELNTLLIKLEDGSVLKINDEEGQCCEIRYMACDDNLSSLNGEVLVKIILEDGILCSIGNEGGVFTECAFIKIFTDKNSITVKNYNIHDGYCSGFLIKEEYITTT